MRGNTKVLGIVLAATILAASPSWGEDKYPSRPVSLVNAFAAGGAHDLHCRFLASVANEYLGQPLIVTMKPGAGGVIGTAFAARAKPDGYTLLSGGTGPNSISCQIEDTGYTKDSFVPIAKINHLTLVVAVKSDKPWKNFSELLNHIAKDPKKVVFGTTGVTGITGLSNHMLLRSAGINTSPPTVPFKGVSDQILSIAKGDTDYMVQIYSGVIPFIESKEIRPLAVLDEKRLASLPNVPTARELGYDVVANMWVAVLAPKGTPENIINHLSVAFGKMVEDPSFKEMMKKLGLPIYFEDRMTFQKTWDQEYKKFGELIRELGLQKKK